MSKVAPKKQVTSKAKVTANPIPPLAPKWRLDMMMPHLQAIDSLIITSQQPNPAPIEGTLAFSGYVKAGNSYFLISGEVYASDGDEFETIFFMAVDLDVFIFKGMAQSKLLLPHPSDLNHMSGGFHHAKFPPIADDDGNWTATSQGGQGDEDRPGEKPGGRRPR